jgi:Flp pilus assembly protein TadD
MDTSSVTVPSPARRRWIVWLVVALSVVAGINLAAVVRLVHARWSVHQDPPPALVYRNTALEVQYKGDASCAACHPDQSEAFHHHPMSRSLAAVAIAGPMEHYDASAGDPFAREGYQFSVERRDGKVIHRDLRRDAQGRIITEFATEIAFAIGSGARGRTYLVQWDGFLFQSPISWFSNQSTWDLTPGFHAQEHFDRPAQVQCLFCHCNQVEPVPHTLNRYRVPIFRGESIGCERCHGPGELHVLQRERGVAPDKIDDTIVNPRRLEPGLRDSVCHQCHLQGESRILRRGRELFQYRPGLPLDAFVSVFLRAPEFTDNQKAGSHGAQMAVSRCYQASSGALGCISCHDAHRLPPPQTKAEFYRERCLQCHSDRPCALPEATRRARLASDDCTTCHMPRAASSNIAHTAVTDHRILRRADRPSKARPPSPSRRGAMPLVLFHQGQAGPDNPELARDLGLALAELGADYRELRKGSGALALPLLETAVDQHPDDVAAWEGKGLALGWLDRKEEALLAFDQALALVPAREAALTYAGTFAQELGRMDAAAGYWERAVGMSPWSSQYRLQLASAWARRSDWAPAVQEAETALRLNPGSEAIRTLLVASYLRQGRREAAVKELETLCRLNPANEALLRRWYSEQAESRQVPRP